MYIPEELLSAEHAHIQNKVPNNTDQNVHINYIVSYTNLISTVKQITI